MSKKIAYVQIKNQYKPHLIEATHIEEDEDKVYLLVYKNGNIVGKWLLNSVESYSLDEVQEE